VTTSMHAKASLFRVFLVALIIGVAGQFAPLYAADPPEEDNGDVPEHHYVRLDTITVTLFGENSIEGLYTVAATLEIADSDQRSFVNAGKSRLRDAMLVELHKLLARRKGGAIPLDAVKFRLRDVARRTLGEDVVVDLFVENVLRKDVAEDSDKES
jgi:flagellar basal body-associated protein FliL